MEYKPTNAVNFQQSGDEKINYLPALAASGTWGFDTPTQDMVDEFEPGDPRLLFTILEPEDVFPKTVGEEVLNFYLYPNTGYHNQKSYLPQSRWSQVGVMMHGLFTRYVMLMFYSSLQKLYWRVVEINRKLSITLTL